MKVRILHVLELSTAHSSGQLTTTLLKTLAMIKSNKGLSSDCSTSPCTCFYLVLTNESREHVIATLYTITSINQQVCIKGVFPLLHCRTIKYHKRLSLIGRSNSEDQTQPFEMTPGSNLSQLNITL